MITVCFTTQSVTNLKVLYPKEDVSISLLSFKRQRKDKVVGQLLPIDYYSVLFHCLALGPTKYRPYHNLTTMKCPKNEVRANGILVTILPAHAIIPACFIFPFSLPLFIILIY